MTDTKDEAAAAERRLPEAAARAVVERCLNREVPTHEGYGMCEDGETGWAFWVLDHDTTSYVHPDGKVEWYGTAWPEGYDEDGQERPASEDAKWSFGEPPWTYVEDYIRRMGGDPDEWLRRAAERLEGHTPSPSPEVLERRERWTLPGLGPVVLSEKGFDGFLEMLEDDSPPTPALVALMAGKTLGKSREGAESPPGSGAGHDAAPVADSLSLGGPFPLPKPWVDDGGMAAARADYATPHPTGCALTVEVVPGFLEVESRGSSGYEVVCAVPIGVVLHELHRAGLMPGVSEANHLLRDALQHVDNCAHGSMHAGFVARDIRRFLGALTDTEGT